MLATVVIIALCALPALFLVGDLMRPRRGSAPAAATGPQAFGSEALAAGRRVEPLVERRTNQLAFVGADRRVAQHQSAPAPTESPAELHRRQLAQLRRIDTQAAPAYALAQSA